MACLGPMRDMGRAHRARTTLRALPASTPWPRRRLVQSRAARSPRTRSCATQHASSPMARVAMPSLACACLDLAHDERSAATSLADKMIESLKFHAVL
ncbi:hypothetical protein EJB05_04708, partial [Eragrostis curvula]